MKTAFKAASLFVGTICSFGAIGFSSIAQAASLSPSTFEATIGIGETVTVNKVVTLSPAGPATSLVDVFFLADNTGSMGSVLNSVKSNATSILGAISGGDPRFAGIDVNFGVGSYFGDPLAERLAPTSAYRLLQPITGNTSNVVTAINSWVASGGGDFPEGNFFALHQVATSGAPTPDTNIGTGLNTGWRENAGKVVVWFGDAPSHTTTIGLPETIDALLKNNVKVAAIDSSGFLNQGNQATSITNATGGTYTRLGGGTSSVVEAILAAVEDATSTIDLELFTEGDTSGLGIAFSCTDPLGCIRVGPGESRTFAMDITGRTPGTYEFKTLVRGVAGAVEEDRITVTSDVDTVVPTPALLPGLIGMGAAALRKRKKGGEVSESEA